MGVSRVTRLLPRTSTVQEQWFAWLPQEKDQLYTTTINELEVCYVIASVSLDDGFSLCKQGKLLAAREQAVMFSSLYDRLAERLHGVSRTMTEHGRQYGIFASVAPLHLEWFRSETARHIVRHHRFTSRLAVRSRSHFFRKLTVLDELTSKLQQDTRRVSGEIADGTTLRWRTHWAELEALHDDLNTCLRETTVVLKSFFCVLPEEDVADFARRLHSLSPAPISASGRRWDPFLPKMAPACR